LSLIISIIFSILIIFVSIIFHIKSSLAKNYLMSPLLHTIFNFLLNYMLLFPQQRVVLSTSFFKTVYTRFHLDENPLLSFLINSLLCHKNIYVIAHLLKMKLSVGVALEHLQQIS
jgi:hypothetical protein